MKRKNPDYVQQFIDHDGSPRFYLRKPGVKRVRLPGLPWSPEFMAAYEAGLGNALVPEIGVGRTKPGTVNAAIVSYHALSADFRDMATSTKRMRRAILERFRSEYGHRNIATLDERALKAILAKRKPLAAVNLLKTLRSLLRHAIDVNIRKDDPTANIRLKTPKSDGHHSWTEEEILAFERRHPIGTKARLALTLLLHRAAPWRRRADGRGMLFVNGERLSSVAEPATLFPSRSCRRSGRPSTLCRIPGSLRSWCRRGASHLRRMDSAIGSAIDATKQGCLSVQLTASVKPRQRGWPSMVEQRISS